MVYDDGSFRLSQLGRTFMLYCTLNISNTTAFRYTQSTEQSPCSMDLSSLLLSAPIQLNKQQLERWRHLGHISQLFFVRKYMNTQHNAKPTTAQWGSTEEEQGDLVITSLLYVKRG